MCVCGQGPLNVIGERVAGQSLLANGCDLASFGAEEGMRGNLGSGTLFSLMHMQQLWLWSHFQPPHPLRLAVGASQPSTSLCGSAQPEAQCCHKQHGQFRRPRRTQQGQCEGRYIHCPDCPRSCGSLQWLHRGLLGFVCRRCSNWCRRRCSAWCHGSDRPPRCAACSTAMAFQWQKHGKCDSRVQNTMPLAAPKAAHAPWCARQDR